MVAALVRGLDDEENWILAEVVSFLPSQNKYEVDDIDEEQKDRHILSKCRVVPLPLMRANPETDGAALFPKGTMGNFDWLYWFSWLIFTNFILFLNLLVNALYPQTTCFYKAIINQLPLTATEEYELLFEDASYADGFSPPLCVPQRYVITYKHTKKVSSMSSWQDQDYGDGDEYADDDGDDDEDDDDSMTTVVTKANAGGNCG